MSHYLTRFRIRNLKCFEDTNWVDSPMPLALVGQNECGKSTILQGLAALVPRPERRGRIFNLGRDFSRIMPGVPTWPDSTPIVAGEYRTAAEGSLGLVSLQRFGDGRAAISTDGLPPTFVSTEAELLRQVPSYNGRGKTIVGCWRTFTSAIEKAKGNGLTVESLRAAIGQNRSGLLSALNALIGTPGPETGEAVRCKDELSVLEDWLKELAGAEAKQLDRANRLYQSLPQSLLVNRSVRVLGEVPLSALATQLQKDRLSESYQATVGLLLLAGIDPRRESGLWEPSGDYRFVLEAGGGMLTSVLNTHWSQSDIEFRFSRDGDRLFIDVRDETLPCWVRLDRRSEGFQSFLATDLLLSTREPDRGVLLLLDEPGVSLYPQAQEDLVDRIWEESQTDRHLIYTTHSPFMLRIGRPEHIRSLVKTPAGVNVQASAYRFDSTQPLLLQAALGITARQSLLVAERNLVVEGVHEVLVIDAVCDLLLRLGRQPLTREIRVTPAGSASKVPTLTAFLLGQELSVLALLDSDAAGVEVRDFLVKRWFGEMAKVVEARFSAITVSEVLRRDSSEGYTVEDLLPRRCYVTAFANVHKVDSTGSDAEEVCSSQSPILGSLADRFDVRDLRKGTVAKTACRVIREWTDESEIESGWLESIESVFRLFESTLKPARRDQV